MAAIFLASCSKSSDTPCPQNQTPTPTPTPTPTVTPTPPAAPKYDTMSMGTWVAYTDVKNDVWSYDSTINGFYSSYTQEDVNAEDFVTYLIYMVYKGKTYLLPTTVDGATVDWNLTDVGFDINWYKKNGSLPLYPVNPTFEGYVVLLHQGNKSPVVKNHIANNTAARRKK